MKAAELTIWQKIVVWFKKLMLSVLYAVAVYAVIYSFNVPASYELPTLVTRNPEVSLERWAILGALVGLISALLPQAWRVVLASLLLMLVLPSFFMGNSSMDAVSRMLQVMLVACVMPPLASFVGGFYAEGMELREMNETKIFRDFRN